METTLLFLGLVVAAVIVFGVVASWREARARELDAQAEQAAKLRGAALASRLSADAHDARKALIREAFLAGRPPSGRSDR